MKSIIVLAAVITAAAISPAFGKATLDAPKPQGVASEAASPEMLAFSIRPRMPRPRWP
jgi:hypothetical protein